MSNKADATVQDLPFDKVSAWIGGQLGFALGEQIKQQAKRIPRIVVFADIVGSTAAAREDAESAVVKTIAHHVAHGAAAHSASTKPFSARTIKSVGDEVVVSVHPETDVSNEDIGSVLRKLIGALLVTAASLRRDGKIVTKIGVHVCREYTSPLEVLKPKNWFIKEWKKKLRGIPPPELAALFPRGDILGDDMNRAARVAHAAPPNSLLISEDTYNTYLRTQPMDKDGLFVSDRIVFQDLKGIVNPAIIKEAPINLEHRTVRMIAHEKDQLMFVWPFHSCTLVQQGPRAALNLSKALQDSELRHNLLTVMAVDQNQGEEELNIPENPAERRDLDVAAWIEGPRKPKCLGIARFCASSFETYNAIMKACIYGTSGMAMTYTHALMTQGWETTGAQHHAKDKLIASRERQPSPSEDWEKLIKAAEAKDGDEYLLFARTQSFQHSIDAVNELTRPESGLNGRIAEIGLLYGQWDFFVLFKAPNARDTLLQAVRSCKEYLHHNTDRSEAPSGMIYRVTVVEPPLTT